MTSSNGGTGSTTDGNAYAAFLLGYPSSVRTSQITVSTPPNLFTYYYGGYGGMSLQGNGPWVFVAAGSTILLLLFAARRQSADFARSRFPSHAALAIAFLLLAQALLRLAQRGRLPLQPLVGGAQLLLLQLQLLGQRLRLLEQRLGAHAGGDRVDHDPDRLGQLVEEDQLVVAPVAERGQLDDRVDLALEEHRQDDEVERRRLAQAGADLDVVLRHIGEQDLRLLERALADQPLAQLEVVGDVLPLLVGVAGEQLQDDVPLAAVGRAFALGDVEDAVLRGDEGSELADLGPCHRLAGRA